MSEVVQAPHSVEWQTTPSVHEEHVGQQRRQVLIALASLLCLAIVTVLVVVILPFVSHSTAAPVPWLGYPSAIEGIACPSVGQCIVVGAEGVDANGGPPVAFVSSNGGTSWELSELPPSLGDATLTQVSCPTVAYCLSLDNEGTLLTSTDVGLHWRVMARGVSGLDVGALSPEALQCLSDVRCLAITDDGVLVMSTDGGKVWQPDPMPAVPVVGVGPFTVSAFACPSAKTCVVVGDGAGETYFASTDGGGSWQAQSLPFGAPLPDAVSCGSPRSCMVMSTVPPTVLPISFMGGTWSVGRSRPLPGIFPSSLICSSATHCLALGIALSASGVPLLLQPETEADISDDGGTSWGQVTLPDLYPMFPVCPTATSCMALDGGSSIISDDLKGAVVETTDGGSTWRVCQPRATR